jgi:hypothetical protein
LLVLSACRSLQTPLELGAYLRAPAEEDINGLFPDAVSIKTRTQTFNAYHYYLINDGFIWYKSIDKTQEPSAWTLFEKTGLPHNPRKWGFSKPKKIVNLSADADELVALSEDGGFYRYCFDKNIAHKSKVWLDRQGWPQKEQLFLDERTAKNSAWALGKRNAQVLYYEDPFGNQHHNGTQEIATTYVLLQDGQEICYADTGLPSDFSRNYIGPERGAFKAMALSASASTMFVINDAGEMYTRIADFDIIGADPMFFKYTYSPYTSDLPGTNYFSNLTEWGLPAEDWRPQPRLPLSGKAAFSRFITILQNGQGNAARELRVAGRDANGNTGYWTKGIFESHWAFKTVPLYFPVGSLVQNPAEKGERLQTLDTRLQGYRWDGGEREAETTYELTNFNILEGSCEFKVSRRGETCTLTLHPVELWTYQKRDFMPGRNGPPKLFFGTLDRTENALEGLSEAFTEYLQEHYLKHDKALFQYTLAAKTHYVMLRDRDTPGSVVFLTDGTIPNDFSAFQKTWHLAYADEVAAFNSPELSASSSTAAGGSGAAAFTRENLEELQHKIALNETLRSELKAKIASEEQAKLFAFGMSFFYLPLDGIAKYSPLRFMEVPKIRTMTRFGEKIVTSNGAYINTVADTQIWVYQKLVELLDVRITMLTDLAKVLTKEVEAAPPAWFSENVAGYWDSAGLPHRVSGVFLGPSLSSPSATPADLSFRSRAGEQELFGWYLAIGDAPGFSIFVDPEKSVKTIVARKGKTPQERMVNIACTLHINENRKTALEKEVIERSLGPFKRDTEAGIPVTIMFDGTDFVIKEHPASHSNQVIFRGKGVF